jgi:hypothetical protein
MINLYTVNENEFGSLNVCTVNKIQCSSLTSSNERPRNEKMDTFQVDRDEGGDEDGNCRGGDSDEDRSHEGGDDKRGGVIGLASMS